MQKNKSYFLVWNPVTGYTRHRHETHESAIAEARRLADQHNGSEFVVLQAMSSTIKQSVVTTFFEIDDMIPF